MSKDIQMGGIVGNAELVTLPHMLIVEYHLGDTIRCPECGREFIFDTITVNIEKLIKMGFSESSLSSIHFILCGYKDCNHLMPVRQENVYYGPVEGEGFMMPVQIVNEKPVWPPKEEKDVNV